MMFWMTNCLQLSEKTGYYSTTTVQMKKHVFHLFVLWIGKADLQYTIVESSYDLPWV
jgi:hypothetical protein